VKCGHGSTVGEMDEAALFYLRSRGLSVDDAQLALTLAFANEVVDAIRTPTVADHIRRRIVARLPGGADMKEIL